MTRGILRWMGFGTRTCSFQPNTIITITRKDILPLMEFIVQRAFSTLIMRRHRGLADDDSRLPSTEGCTRSNHRQKHHHGTASQQLISSHHRYYQRIVKTTKGLAGSNQTSPSQSSLDRYQHNTNHHKQNRYYNQSLHHRSSSSIDHHINVIYLVWEYVEKGISLRDKAAVWDECGCDEWVVTVSVGEGW